MFACQNRIFIGSLGLFRVICAFVMLLGMSKVVALKKTHQSKMFGNLQGQKRAQTDYQVASLLVIFWGGLAHDIILGLDSTLLILFS